MSKLKYLVVFETTIYNDTDDDLDEIFSFRIRARATDEAAAIALGQEIQAEIEYKIKARAK